MKTCPFTQKECNENCQLYLNGSCAIALIAENQHYIANATGSIANKQQEITTAVKQINQNKR